MTPWPMLCCLTGIFLLSCVRSQPIETPQLRVNQAGLSERLARSSIFAEEDKQKQGSAGESPSAAR